MRIRTRAVLCFALLAALHLSLGKPLIAADTTTPAMGVLSGRVTRGPLSPVEVPGMPRRPNQVAGARIEIERQGTARAQFVETNSNGEYRVLLPPGIYKITIPSLYGAMFTKDLPATVTIVSGQQTLLDIHLDTGIR